MMNFDPKIPYDDLPALPPAQDLETKEILKLCTSARVALEGLRQMGKTIPNEGVLINTIPLLEAQASSEIENIVTTTDRLFRFADTNQKNADSATKEALRYRSALRQGSKVIAQRPLSAATAIEVCRTIKDADMNIRKSPVYIGNKAAERVVYTPPNGQDVLRAKLLNWEKFLHADETIDPLIRMAAGHYQFEAIHPFTDGNGRTGRILNILYLVDKGLLDVPVLYLSRYIIQHKADYYRLLLEVTTKGEWQPWIEFMLRAVAETALWTRQKVEAVHKLNQATKEFVKEWHAGIYTFELVEQLFMQPYVRISNLVTAGVAHRETASKRLKELCATGVLEERKEGRDKLFLNVRFLELLQSDSNEFRAFDTYPSV
jgi:Fic family protein